MTDTNCSIFVMVIVIFASSFVFQVSDATIGSRGQEEDFTWKHNGEVNIGKHYVP